MKRTEKPKFPGRKLEVAVFVEPPLYFAKEPLTYGRFFMFGVVQHKLRSIGYFFETQDPNHVCPVDIDEVQYGISLILNEITAEMIKISENLGKRMGIDH